MLAITKAVEYVRKIVENPLMRTRFSEYAVEMNFNKQNKGFDGHTGRCMEFDRLINLRVWISGRIMANNQ